MRIIIALFAALALALAPLVACAEAVSPEAALEIVADPGYDALHQYLLAGNTVKSGLRGDEALAFQRLLNELGANIAADGAAGAKTMGAMNAIRVAIADEPASEELTPEVFAELVRWLLIADDEARAVALYYGSEETLDEAAIYEIARVQEQAGNLYSAYRRYSSVAYLDSAERAAGCLRAWPSDGEVYRNADAGSACSMTIVGAREAGTATCVKLYLADGTLASAVFIAGSGSAKVKLPTGQFIIACGYGTTWFGAGEAFGREASYERLTPEGGGAIELKRGFSYTLTLGDDGPLAGVTINWADF